MVALGLARRHVPFLEILSAFVWQNTENLARSCSSEEEKTLLKECHSYL